MCPDLIIRVMVIRIRGRDVVREQLEIRLCRWVDVGLCVRLVVFVCCCYEWVMWDGFWRAVFVLFDGCVRVYMFFWVHIFILVFPTTSAYTPTTSVSILILSVSIPIASTYLPLYSSTPNYSTPTPQSPSYSHPPFAPNFCHTQPQSLPSSYQTPYNISHTT